MLRRLAILFLALTLLPLTASAQNEPGHTEPVYPPDLYPVVIEIAADEKPYTHANTVLRSLDVPREEFSARIRYVYRYAINGYSLLLSPYEIERAERLFGEGNLIGVTNLVTEQVTFSIPDTVEPFDVQGKTSDALTGTEVVPVGVLRTGAPLDDASNVDIASVDTGVDRTNPDLNVVGGYDCIDPEQDYGFDGHGHGTHTAGTMAAKQDGRGVIGVAPGARIWSVRVLDSSGAGSLASIVCGLDFIAEHADVIDVVNLSLGGQNGFPGEVCGGRDPMLNAFCTLGDLGVISVAAAGNSTADAEGFVPAGYDEVVTISAFTDYDGRPGGFALAPNAGCTAYSVDDELAAFSNYGDAVDLTAPGVCVLSTYLDGKFAYASGTSMSAPHASGCFAAFVSAHPDQRDHAVDQILAVSRADSEFTLPGDHDSTPEPVLSCSSLLRYEAN